MEAERERLALALGRSYVAGDLEADELDARLTTLYAAQDAVAAAAVLDGLPDVAPVYVPEVRQAGWWRRRHGESARADATWSPTTERFVDPTTQRVMRVWVDPATRARHYLPER